jgi:hypothetical protein
MMMILPPPATIDMDKPLPKTPDEEEARKKSKLKG